jgi:cardiolipin synthase
MAPSIGRLHRRRILCLAISVPLAGCASVPDIVHLPPRLLGLHADDARGGEHNRDAQNQDAHRPAQQHIDEPGALQQQYELQRALSATPLVTGNRVTLLQSGAEALVAMFAALRTARHSINLEYFILANVRSGSESLLSVLLDRLRAGVAVNIIHDSFGSRATPDTFFAALRQGGASIVASNPIDPLRARAGWSPNDRDHRKIMVIDGRVGFTGGINLDPTYDNPPSAGIPPDRDTAKAYWADIAIRIEGPAVAELQKLFLGTWREQKGPPIDQAGYFPPLRRAGVQTIRIIGSSPGQQQPLYFESLMTAINSARQRVWLCSGYFVPPHAEREALAKAARAGIDVRIVTPSFSDVQSAVYAARAAYGDLLEAGAHIYEMHNAVLHAKAAVVDNTWTAIGSSNLDRRSVVFNNEDDAVIVGHDTAAQVEALLKTYMAASVPVDLKRWEHRPLGERLDEIEARIWQYWM